jgi:UMF1 family MFS transporter
MGRFVPPEAENELFGFFAFSGKLTAFIGPFLLGTITQATGSQRLGVSVVLGLFVLGLAIMSTVDEQEGIAVAGRPGAAAPPVG